MFEKLPIELMEKLCGLLNLSVTAPLPTMSNNLRTPLESKKLFLLNKKFEEAKDDFFYAVLNLVLDDEKAIVVKDDDCKSILLNLRPKVLPHWLLNLMEMQPDTAAKLLLDEQYKASLTPGEFSYLVDNYPLIKETVVTNKIVPPLQHIHPPPLEPDPLEQRSERKR